MSESKGFLGDSMEINEKSKSQKSLSLKKAHQFLENLKSEFFKIQWTDSEEVKVYAKITVATTFVLGLLIYFVDLVIQKALFSIEMLFKWIFG